MRLLLAEDDPMIGESVHRGLVRQGFAVDWSRDGKSAALALESGVYDLVVLDLGLPRLEGTEVLKSMRRRGDKSPVLILTARDAVGDRVKGLDAGADDYLVKPFDLDELGARVRALLRRRSGHIEPIVRVGDLQLNQATQEVSVKGEPVSLSGRERGLLMALLDRPGAILSRAQLEEKLYGWGEEVESNTVEVHIHSLRKKLGRDLIKNVRGVGYRIQAGAEA